MLEVEMTLSLLEWGKVNSFLPTIGVPNKTSKDGSLSYLSLAGAMQIARGPTSSFSYIVDEVFELERRSSIQNVSSSFNPSSVSQFGFVPMNLHAIKAGTPSPKWEGISTQINNVAKILGVETH